MAGTPRIFLNIILTSKQPSKVQFWISILNFQLLNPLKFYFSSITPFFLPKFSNPYCRKGSYGPYGPFWFSAKNRRDLVKRYQNEKFWEKSNFHFIRKMNLFYGGKFLKRSLVSGPRKLIFSCSDSENLNPFQEPAILAATQSNQ